MTRQILAYVVSLGRTMLVLSWSYPLDEDNLVSGPSKLGRGPSRLDLGSSDLDVV